MDYDHESMLRGRVARVVLATIEYFQMLDEVQRNLELSATYNDAFQIWVKQGVDIRRACKDKNYICAANLVILMEWQMQADERWSSINGVALNDASHAREVSQYVDLRESLDHAIQSVQLAVLLRSLAPQP
jgi:hypothetical protein